jgi:hypothetical protein
MLSAKISVVKAADAGAFKYLGFKQALIDEIYEARNFIASLLWSLQKILTLLHIVI